MNKKLEMKITGYRRSLCRTWIFATLLLGISSCMQDEFDLSGGGREDEGRLRLTFLMDDMGEDVLTRATEKDTQNERKIRNMDILCFDSGTGKLRDIETVALSQDLIGNGAREFTVYSSVNAETNDRLVFVCNHAGRKTAGGLTVGTSVSTDIYAGYNHSGWLSAENKNKAGDFNRTDTVGYNMPMYGDAVVTADRRIANISLRRSVAKVQVELAADGNFSDATGLFGNDRPMSFRVVNVPTVHDMRVGNPPAGLNTLTDIDYYHSNHQSALGNYFRISGNNAQWGNPTATQCFRNHAAYLPQGNYSVSVYDATKSPKVKTLPSTKWDKNRLCLLLELGMPNGRDNRYYRIDLSKDGQFIDLLPNHSYRIIITKVLAEGYQSYQEALEHPGSNLNYEIIVDKPEAMISNGNGSYAINLSNDGKIFYRLKGTHELAKVCYTRNADINETMRTNSISLYPANLSGVSLVFSSGGARIEEQVKTISLKFDDNQEKSGFVCLALGNLRDTISFHRYGIAAAGEQRYNVGGQVENITWEMVETVTDGYNSDEYYDKRMVNHAKLRLEGTTLVIPELARRARSLGVMRGGISRTVNGKTHKAELTVVDIDHVGVSAEDVITFPDGFGQDVIVYFPHHDNTGMDNVANTWTDHYDCTKWNKRRNTDLVLPLFDFTLKRGKTVKIKAGNTGARNSLSIYHTSQPPTGWQANLNNWPEVTLRNEARVKLDLYFTVNDMDLQNVIEIKDEETGASYVLRFGRKNVISSQKEEILDIQAPGKFLYRAVDVGKNHISSIKGLRYGTGKVFSSMNPFVDLNATINKTPLDLGFRSERFVCRNTKGIKELHYLSQMGLGITSKGIIKIARITADNWANNQVSDNNRECWSYYIPAGNDTQRNWGVAEVGGELRFIIGKTEALEVPNNTPIGTHWSNFNNNSPHSFNYDKSGWREKFPSMDIGKAYTNFVYTGKTDYDVCQKVYPHGCWRKPTKAELQSWATPVTVNGQTYTSEFPIIKSFSEGIVLNIGGKTIMIDAPYIISSNGTLGGRQTPGYNHPMIKGIKIGDYYYIYKNPGNAVPGEESHSTYPLIWRGNKDANSAPAEDLTVSPHNYRDACAVLCIRE